MSMDNFDSLKREATKLERNLEDKVARYQQVRVTLVIRSCHHLPIYRPTSSLTPFQSLSHTHSLSLFQYLTTDPFTAGPIRTR